MHIETVYTHGILIQHISTGLGLFWDDLKKIPSETWTHPPTSIVISVYWNFFLCKPPKHVFCKLLMKNQTIVSVQLDSVVIVNVVIVQCIENVSELE